MTEQKVIPPKQQVINLVNEAASKLLEAHAVAVKHNPLAQDLPVFQQLLIKQKELGTTMQEINKLRGL